MNKPLFFHAKLLDLINVSRVKSTAFVKCVPLLIWHLRLLERLIHVRLAFLALAKTYPCSLGTLGLRCLSEHLLFTTAA